MFHLLLTLLFAGAVTICIVLAVIHAFPVIFIVLALIGIFKLYQLVRGPRRPNGWW